LAAIPLMFLSSAGQSQTYYKDLKFPKLHRIR
jgi:hypothetical protein